MGIKDLDLRTIIKYVSYAVAGIAVLSLVSTNPVHVGVIAASALAYFVAEKVL